MRARGSWVIERDFRSAPSVDHLLNVNGNTFYDSFEEFFSLLGSSYRRLFVRLIRPHFGADILGKSGQGERCLEFLCMAGQIIWKLVATLKQFLCVHLGEHVPV